MEADRFIADIGIRSPSGYGGDNASHMTLSLRVQGSFDLFANHPTMTRFLLQEKLGEYRGS